MTGRVFPSPCQRSGQPESKKRQFSMPFRSAHAAALLPRGHWERERRMDDRTNTPRSIVSEISEVARDGLILWRLTRSGDRDLWCLVFDTSIGFFLVVEDQPKGIEPPCINERHADIIALVGRTDTLKDTFLRDGWAEVDVD